jgi:hypothetical protein
MNSTLPVVVASISKAIRRRAVIADGLRRLWAAELAQ